MFEKINTWTTVKEIKAFLPRSTRNIETSLDGLVESEVLVCDGAGEDKKYQGNRKSKIFLALFNIDVEVSDQAHERKKRLRAQMMNGPKK